MEKVKLYKGEVEIFFERRRHKYTHADNSPILPVSKVIGILDKAALVWWAAGEAAKHIWEYWDTKRVYSLTEKMALCKEAYFKHREKKEKKALQGKAVHDFAEETVNGKQPTMPENEQVRNGTIGFMKWWNETKLEPVKTERIVYSRELDIAGRTDLTAKKKVKGRNGYHIVDYKAVSMYKKAKFYQQEEFPEGFVIDPRSGDKIKYPVFDGPILQVAAYRGFMQEEAGKKYGESYVIRFDQEFGDFDITTLSDELQNKAYEAFKHMVEVARYLEKYKVKF